MGCNMPVEKPTHKYTGIRLDTNTYSEVTRERDPNDTWDGDDVAYDTTIRYAYLSDKDCSADVMAEGEVKVGDPIYIVVVTYGDGDTFHHTTGNTDYLMAYKDKAHAEGLVKTLHDNYDSRDKEDRYSFSYREHTFSTFNWVGYFNSLEGVEIVPMTVY